MKRSRRLSYIGLVVAVVGVIAFFASKQAGSENIGYLSPLIPVGIITFVFSRFLD